MRLDQLLVQNGMFKSRSKAIEAIQNKSISVNGVVRKASYKCDGTETIEIIGFVNPYVSRAALKLEQAIKEYDIDFSNRTVLDVGASTGGFTEVSLKYGAKTVYAVDVGTLQLVEELKSNPKVISYENTNILTVNETHFTEGKPNIIVMDVSFVSIKKIIPYIKQFADEMVVLIKPQFESEGKYLHNGVIREEKIRVKILNDVLLYLKEQGLSVKGTVQSPIKGKEGNIEYIAYIK